MTEFAKYFLNSKTEDKQFFSLLLIAYGGKYPSKCTKNDKREKDIIGVPLNCLLMCDISLFEPPKARQELMLELQTGFARRSMITFIPRIKLLNNIDVKQAFNLYDSGMYSLRSLTEKLYQDGLRSKAGKRIPKTSVEKMLKIIFYTGVFKFEDKIYENAKHKPIISKELFYRVQDRLINPNKTRKQNYDFAYTGMIRCGYCGCLLTAELKKGKYIYYHCTGNKGGNCKRDYINEVKIDKSISEILKLIIIPQELRERISNELKIVHEKKNGYSKEVKNNIIKQITRLENRIEEAIVFRTLLKSVFAKFNRYVWLCV